MTNDSSKQGKLSTRKLLRLTIDEDVIRLSKSKAASQEISLSLAVENLLKGWINGTHKFK